MRKLNIIKALMHWGNINQKLNGGSHTSPKSRYIFLSKICAVYIIKEFTRIHLVKSKMRRYILVST